MNILHLIKSLGRGGAEMLLPETIAVHNREAFSFHVIYFLPWKNQLVEPIRQAGGVVSCLPASNNIRILLQARRVAQYVRQHNIDVVHCHLPWAGFVGRIVHRLTGVPVLYTEHNKQERYHPATKLLNRFSFHAQTAAIAVSDEVAASIRKNIAPQIPVHTVLNGVNVQRFQHQAAARTALRQQLGIAEDTLLMGTIAVFRFQKRLDLWLEVFERLKREGVGREAEDAGWKVGGRGSEAEGRRPQVEAAGYKLKAVLVGDGPLMGAVQAKVRALGLEHDVLLPGLQTNTVDWLSAMDVYMMSSVFEGLPIALLEAMSCGLPVVCTNAGGTGEVIRDGVDGYVVPVAEPLQLLAPLSALLADAGLRQRMGIAARQRVVERFSLERMVGALEELYWGVVNNE